MHSVTSSLDWVSLLKSKFDLSVVHGMESKYQCNQTTWSGHSADKLIMQTMGKYQWTAKRARSVLCKCGGASKASTQSSHIICDWCGSKQTLWMYDKFGCCFIKVDEDDKSLFSTLLSTSSFSIWTVNTGSEEVSVPFSSSTFSSSFCCQTPFLNF